MQYERTKLWQINKSTFVSFFFFFFFINKKEKKKKTYFLALNSKDTGSALFRVQKYRLLLFKYKGKANVRRKRSLFFIDKTKNIF